MPGGPAARHERGAAKGSLEEPEVLPEVLPEMPGAPGPERSASIPTRTVADLESEWSRMEQLEKFFDAHAADMATMEQVAQADPAFERLRRARARRGVATVPGQNLNDLGVPGMDGEVGVKIRTPYVRGALDRARRAMRQRRRVDSEARVASDVRRAEQDRAISPSEMLGDEDVSPKSQGSHVPFSLSSDHHTKKEKQHKTRGQRVSILSPKEKVYVESEKVEESPALDLICAEEDGFVQLEKVSDGTFRYEVRLANGRKVENLFHLFSENREDAEDGMKERQSKDVRKSEDKKGKIKKNESTLVANAVMKPASTLRGNLGWDIEIFPSQSEMWRRKFDPGK